VRGRNTRKGLMKPLLRDRSPVNGHLPNVPGASMEVSEALVIYGDHAGRAVGINTDRREHPLLQETPIIPVSPHLIEVRDQNRAILCARHIKRTRACPFEEKCDSWICCSVGSSEGDAKGDHEACSHMAIPLGGRSRRGAESFSKYRSLTRSRPQVKRPRDVAPRALPTSRVTS